MKTRGLQIAALFLAAAVARGAAQGVQEWAKVALSHSPRHQEWVEVQHEGRKVQCFVVYPEVSGKVPAVLMIHEIFGLTDWAKEAADEVAAAGYVAIMPDLLSGEGPNGGGTSAFDANDVSAVTKAVSRLPQDQVMADLDAAANYIGRQAACDGRIFVAGFCWGGGKSFAYATHRSKLLAAFVFYGPPPAAEAMTSIACPVYGFYAGNDARISLTVPATKTQMAAAGKRYQAVVYPGAGHGFMRAGDPLNPGADAANRSARNAAWQRLVMALSNDSAQ